MRKNEIQVLVNWGDTDVAGIVYYPNFFKWFDIAGHHFFRNAGLSPLKLSEEQQIILPILDTRCTFKHALYYDDILTIKTAASEINNKTIKLNHEIFRNDTMAGSGYELRGWVKKQKDGSISAVRIPDHVRQVLMDEPETETVEQKPMFNA
ncbi:acyl-CoA thioesterase [Domibacillus epiphyticus]|uniref:4-hydroxybenzoyl-CoA thioesterase n=1 Tax=Domibacillus epiphyticus TaxID=1714355 RepID=A0A1V2A8J1_9BACI|nr:thioesterase family protein [Domibacillus epiphyticus]OMP67286.1 4-hydroxybenzoyl-CoA thioesterase [Domibacillus epiphyticus]